jgi:hypothetical protein
LRVLDKALGDKLRFRRLLVLIVVTVAAVGLVLSVVDLFGGAGALRPAAGMAGLARVIGRRRGTR